MTDTGTDTGEFNQSLAFFGIGEDDWKRQSRLSRAVSRFAPEALRRFYAKVSATPEVARMFGSKAMMDSAKARQAEHWHHIFGRKTDGKFRARSEQIGLVHARIGLEPRWYIGGYAMVLEDMIAGMIGKTGLNRLVSGNTARDVASLVKLALLDMSIALSSYFKAEEETRNAAIDALAMTLERMARGDFATKVEGLPAAYRRLEADLDSMRAHVEASLSSVAKASGTIQGGSSEIRQASDDLARRTEQQAARLEETAAALSDVTGGARQTATGADMARDAIGDARKRAIEGGDVVSEAVQAMDDIQRSSEEIGQIIGVIDGIAFQTNLLALNAGVEAARAGDAGRGFAVVASEVRALAQRSADAAADIKRLIDTSGQQVARGVSLVGRSGEVFAGIAASVNGVSEQVARIAELSAEQSSNLENVNSAVRDMDIGTQQNAAMVEESNAAARSLANEAERLNTLVSGFSLASVGHGSASWKSQRAA